MVDPYASEQTTHLPQLDLPTEVISDKSWLWFNEHIGPNSAVRPDVMRNMAAHYLEFGRKLREIAGRLRFRASIHADNWRGADARASQQAFRQLHGTANALADTSQQMWLALTSMAGTAEQVQQEMLDDQTYFRVDYLHLNDRRPDDADADRARQRFIMLMESYSDAIETQMPRSVSSNIPQPSHSRAGLATSTVLDRRQREGLTTPRVSAGRDTPAPPGTPAGTTPGLAWATARPLGSIRASSRRPMAAAQTRATSSAMSPGMAPGLAPIRARSSTPARAVTPEAASARSAPTACGVRMTATTPTRPWPATTRPASAPAEPGSVGSARMATPDRWVQVASAVVVAVPEAGARPSAGPTASPRAPRSAAAAQACPVKVGQAA